MSRSNCRWTWSMFNKDKDDLEILLKSFDFGKTKTHFMK